LLRVRAEDEAAFLAFCDSAKGAVVRLPPVSGHPGGVNAALRTFFRKTFRGDAPPSGWVDYDVTLATMALP
jgi:hypothetical protein